MILVALAGLPGTGKSTLARRLAAELDAPLLDKDAVRAAVFGPRWTDHTRAQDDLCVGFLQAAARSLVGRAPFAVLDGRTYTRAGQVDALRAAARDMGAGLRLIECVCDPAEAERRLAADAAAGAHPAANRGVELHRALRASAVPVPSPKLVLATDAEPPDELLRRALAHARGAADAAAGRGERDAPPDAR